MINDTIPILNAKTDLSILFMGDFCPVGHVFTASNQDRQNLIFSDFKTEFEQKDISIANLECPLTLSDTKSKKVGPNLKAHPITIKAIRECLLDILNLSNNHIMDYGNTGLLDTTRLLEKNGINYVGAGQNIKDASSPLLLNRNGISLAFLSFCETEFNIANSVNPGCAPINEQKVNNALRNAQQQCDLVILSLHCGSEHFPLPSPRIKSLCHSFAKNGATAIICHHTHIYEGFEIYNNVPIFYGLGNLLFDIPNQNSLPNYWFQGYMVRICFNKTKGAVNLKIIPYVFDKEDNTLSKLTEGQRNLFYQHVEELSALIKNTEKLKSIWTAYSLNRYIDWYAPVLRNSRLKLWQHRINRNRLLWHYRTNESHADIIETALSELGKGNLNRDVLSVVPMLVSEKLNITHKFKQRIKELFL